MLFNSYIFIFFFLPVVLTVFWFSVYKNRHDFALNFLVAASLFFYSWWELSFLPILLGSILFNFGVSLWLEEEKQTLKRRGLLIAGLAANLLCLGVFKYAGFFTQIWNDLTAGNAPIAQMVLPLGISFYTFQKIAYLCDLYQRKIAVPRFRDFALFVSFFPQLIAGPIVHARELLPQLLRTPHIRDMAANLGIGFGFFAIGLFKKVIIADTLATYAAPAFTLAQSGEVGFYDAWMGALAYTFQLYFDFSGYTDMAIGLARMMGIKLPYNFLSPYKAASIIDFWRRWHITMSNFFRDYVYIPLGGSRESGAKALCNLMITMLLAGLWHGAGWTFVFWGALHGTYLIINHLFRRYAAVKETAVFSVMGHILTMLAVITGWVFFRADSFDTAATMLTGMMSFSDIPALWNGGSWLSVSGWALPLIAASYILCVSLPNTGQFFDALEGHSWIKARFSFNIKYAALLSFLFVISVFGLQRISEFLYFQF